MIMGNTEPTMDFLYTEDAIQAFLTVDEMGMHIQHRVWEVNPNRRDCVDEHRCDDPTL